MFCYFKLKRVMWRGSKWHLGWPHLRTLSVWYPPSHHHREHQGDQIMPHREQNQHPHHISSQHCSLDYWSSKPTCNVIKFHAGGSHGSPCHCHPIPRPRISQSWPSAIESGVFQCQVWQGATFGIQTSSTSLLESNKFQRQRQEGDTKHHMDSDSHSKSCIPSDPACVYLIYINYIYYLLLNCGRCLALNASQTYCIPLLWSNDSWGTLEAEPNLEWELHHLWDCLWDHHLNGERAIDRYVSGQLQSMIQPCFSFKLIIPEDYLQTLGRRLHDDTIFESLMSHQGSCRENGHWILIHQWGVQGIEHYQLQG